MFVKKQMSEMESEKCDLINSINQLFGELCWSFSITNSTLDFVEKTANGNFSAGAMAIVRIQLTNGVHREDIGFGSSSSMSSKCEAISKAREEAVVAGLKGAFINFGGDRARSHKCTTPAKTELATSLCNLADDKKLPASDVAAACTSSTKLSASSATKTRSVTEKNCDDPEAGTSSPPPAAPLLLRTFAQATLNEDQVKAERIRRSKLKKEEFRKKLLLQAQVQNKGVEKPLQLESGAQHQARMQFDLRMPTLVQHTDSNTKEKLLNNGSVCLDVDDDPLMSTQDMEAALQLAVNGSRRVCSVSPSFQNGILNKPLTVFKGRRNALYNFSYFKCD